jgi:hypothetical protein
MNATSELLTRIDPDCLGHTIRWAPCGNVCTVEIALRWPEIAFDSMAHWKRLSSTIIERSSKKAACMTVNEFSFLRCGAFSILYPPSERSPPSLTISVGNNGIAQRRARAQWLLFEKLKSV